MADLRMPDYEGRYCAFIDILGFRNLIRGIKQTGQTVALRDVMKKIHAPVGASPVSWEVDFRAQSISDAVAISTVAMDSGLFRLVSAIEELALDLLREGYFIRGALVKGQLYHDGSMVFGEALVRAYELERTIARYPSVVIVQEVMEDVNSLNRGLFKDAPNRLKPFIEQADDGPYFVHVLRRVTAEVARVQTENLNKRPEAQQRLEDYERMQDMIQKRLDEAVYIPKHFEKVQWFALYWRKHVPYGAGFKGLVGPGMDRVDWRTG